MTKQTAALLARAATAWVTAAARRAAWVLPLVLLLSVGCAWFSLHNLGIDKSSAALISAEADSRRSNIEYQRAFPQFADNLLVVIESANADLADDAQRRLAASLRDQPKLFPQVYTPDGGEFFARNALLYLTPEELAARAERLAGLLPLLGRLAPDASLGNFLGLLTDAMRAGEPELSVGLDPIFDRLAAAFRANSEGEFFRLAWQELISGDKQAQTYRRFIEVKPRFDSGALSPAAAVRQRIDTLTDELELDAEHDVRLRLTGDAALESGAFASLSQGALLGAALALLVVIIVLFAALGSLRLVFACVLSLAAGLLGTAAFAAATVGTVSFVCVACALLALILGIDFAVHLCLRYRELMRANAPSSVAMQIAAGDAGASLVIGALAMAAGFYAFIATGDGGLAELGLIAGTSMFITLAATLTVVPAVLALLPLRSLPAQPGQRGTQGRNFAPTAIAAWPQTYRRTTIALAAGSAVLAAASLPWLQFNPDTLDLKNPQSESVTTFRELLQTPENSPRSVTALAADGQAAKRLAQRLTVEPEVSRAISIADFIPNNQEAKLGIIRELSSTLKLPEPSPLEATGMVNQFRAVVDLKQALNRLLENNPGARDGAAGRLDEAMEAWHTELAHTPLLQRRERIGELHKGLLAGLPPRLQQLRESLQAERVTLNELPANLRQRWIAEDGRHRVQVYPSANLDDTAAARRFVRAVHSVAPAATGTVVMDVLAGQALARTFIGAFGFALLGIALLLLVLLRSVADTLRVLAPVALAGLLVAGATAALGIAFNFANIIALPLLFGAGVVSAVHVVCRMRHARSEGGLLVDTSTARAVFYSAFTVIAGLGVLAFSQHPGTASLGRLLIIGMLAVLVCTLLVLPATLAPGNAE